MRAAAQLAVLVPLWRGLSLDLGLALGASILANSNAKFEDGIRLPAEPLLYGRAVLGVRYAFR
jgi:hypothetical protein